MESHASQPEQQEQDEQLEPGSRSSPGSLHVLAVHSAPDCSPEGLGVFMDGDFAAGFGPAKQLRTLPILLLSFLPSLLALPRLLQALCMVQLFMRLVNLLLVELPH